MNQIGNLDENQLWLTCFPHFTPVCQKAGAYVMRKKEAILEARNQQPCHNTQLDEACYRLELACAALWPDVENLFVCDFFPHLLAAATDILRAVDFGETSSQEQAPLVLELIDALNGCEQVCTQLRKERLRNSGLILMAAEPKDGEAEPAAKANAKTGRNSNGAAPKPGTDGKI